jgi:hypothetical protein
MALGSQKKNGNWADLPKAPIRMSTTAARPAGVCRVASGHTPFISSEIR